MSEEKRRNFSILKPVKKRKLEDEKDSTESVKKIQKVATVSTRDSKSTAKEVDLVRGSEKTSLTTSSLSTTRLSNKSGPAKKLESNRIDESKYVALDCEMVGVGPKGRINSLARCSIVDYHGNVMYDQYVRPIKEVEITDYRTRWSGIRPRHMTAAITFEQAQKEIVDIIKGKVVVGHALFNDFRALKISHQDTCDTMTLSELRMAGGFNQFQTVSLKRLSEKLLGRKIQNKVHCSVEDSRAAMDLYKLYLSRLDRKQNTAALCSNFMQDKYWPSELICCLSC